VLGLAVMFVVVIYLLISTGVICFAVRKARERDIAGWKWGVPAGLVMYLLVFWDHVPTLVAHKYYCGKEAGFTVYKTLDEWKEKNPGVAETLTWKELSDSKYNSGEMIFYLNERFISNVMNDTVLLSVVRKHENVIDKLTGKTLAQYIDFSTGYGNFVVSAKDLRAYKFWLNVNSCEEDGNKINRKEFYKFKSEIKRLGGKRV